MGMHSSRKLQLEQATLMVSLFMHAFSMTLADSPSNQFLVLLMTWTSGPKG
jgi:hypothetical protein